MKDRADAFRFRDDLHIESSLESETEESLSKLLDETDKDILSIKAQILDLTDALGEKEKKKEALSKKLESMTLPKLEIKLNAPAIHPGASAVERTAFLFNLFRGRRDAYATRYLKKENDSIAYSPVCGNRFQSGCILKLPKAERNNRSCLDCEKRRLTPLTLDTYYNSNIRNYNERGIGAVGIYPMLPGNMCRFLAIDLDEKTWQHDALEIADVARRDGFQMAIERSFSGNGAHLWLFFSEEVPAAKARELAFSFIDKACERSKAVSLKSYDRIFPTQDTITKDGLGNLILMPIVCSAAMRKENPGTVFVDNSFVKYPNQIQFLSSVPQYTRRDVELYLVSSACSASSSFQLSPFSDDDADILWRNRLPAVSQKDLKTDVLPVFLSSGLSIPKAALSARLQNALKRLALFTNPEYYIAKNRNRGYIPDGISLFIETFIESDDVLQLPRGLNGALERYLTQSGIPFRMKDNRAHDTGLDAVFNGELRSEQTAAFEALMSHDIGILQAATSFGKTVVAAKLIAARKERTLILVQSRNLLSQWKDKLQSFLTVNNPPQKREGKRLNRTGIGIYGSAADSLSSYVDVAMIQTVSSRMPEFIREYGMVIVDECHHLAADSFVKVMHAIRPKYVYGLSATVERKDNLEKIVYAQCGSVIYKYTADRLAYRRGMTQVFVPRFTSTTSRTSLSSRFRNNEAQKDIASDGTRNRLIISDIEKLRQKGRRIVVLTHLIDHITELERMLGEKDIPTLSIHGSMSTAEKKKTLEKINSPDNDAVIISTGQFLGEGTDIPYLDTLLVAAPVSWKGVVSQYVGRISREYEGKETILIYDYVDIFIPAFTAMYNKRLRTYRELGYIIKGEKTDNACQNPLGKSFCSEEDIYPVLCSLIRNAEHEIIISSPYLNLSQGTRMIINDLAEAARNGRYVEVRTSEGAFPDAVSLLRSNGITVTESHECYLKYAVFDTQNLLFGELSILGSCINVRNDVMTPSKDKDDPKVMILVSNTDAAEALKEPGLLL